MFAVIILTLNEERNLEKCLASISQIKDVVILDSHSTDRTAEIAKRHGVRVVTRKFDGYASQRNFALQKIPVAHDWILMLDADETLPKGLHDEILQKLDAVDDNVCLFRMRRKDFFLGRWLRRSSGYPTWFGRLIRRGKVKVSREINEEYIPDGKIEALNGHLHHFPFNKGIAEWVEKHNRYSTMEASLLDSAERDRLQFFALFSRDPAIRRKAVKCLFYALPGRPLLIFLSLYFVRLGFIDGRPGLYFCLLRSYYEFIIDLKALEARKLSRDATISSDNSS